ncbi:zinc-binding protein A33-like [Hemitrygon akajei]|uniref:zinc-binding protein A33-like n=1 Tax=Hemitrygon akajei TaxID=2704970 RepID=UPI003BF9B89A
MTLPSNQGSIASSNGSLDVQCVIHSENLILFCNDCVECVCPRCLVGSKHKTHSFSPFEEACKDQKVQILKKVKDLKKIHEKVKKDTDRISLTLKDVERIVVRTKASVEEKYNKIRELLENDMRTTMNLIEAEALSMETLITVQRVDKEAYKDAITSIMERVNEMNRNTDSENVQTLQEFMSWKTRLETFEDLQLSFGKELPVENRRLKSLERSVDELYQSVKKLLPRMWEFIRNITLNENTAHRNLIISRDQTSVQYSTTPVNVHESSIRFENSFSVLANEYFSSGKHYWEVNTKNKNEWNIGVTYSSIARKGKESTLGKNKYSWSIRMVDKEYYAFHGDECILLDLSNADQNCERLGIFLDYEEGRLSFYNIHRGTHLHSFKTKFRKPIFPAFSPVLSKNSKDSEPIVLCHSGIKIREITDTDGIEF